jgi:hypothetical protein
MLQITQSGLIQKLRVSGRFGDWHEQPSSSQGYPRLDDRYLITVLELLKLIRWF